MTVTKSEQETHAFALEFAKHISTPRLILLSGELGAGKTCFVRGLCEGLGGDPRQVSSPTFAIMQEYDIAKNQRLIHIDAYRLSGEEELESIGWDELLQNRGGNYRYRMALSYRKRYSRESNNRAYCSY